MRIGAAYIRVSTDDQTELSPDSQLSEIRAFAARNEIVIPDEYVFIEGEKKKGLSGRKASNRPEFQRMIALAKEKPKPFEVVLVWKFSRFARNIDESTYYKSILRKKCGIDVISISEPIMEGMYGRLIEMIIEWSDEFYSINLATEVKRGMTSKEKAGEFCAYAPFGYKMIDKRLEIDEEQAVIVKWIFEQYAGGAKSNALARELTDRGVRTRFGNVIDHRFITYMVSNPLYKGYIVFSTDGRRKRGEIIDEERAIIQKGIHTPIVDEDLWQKCYNRYISEKRLEVRPPKKNEYALRSLLKCGACGATLTYAVQNRLQCSKYNRGVCRVSHSMDCDVAHKQVVSQLRLDLAMLTEKDKGERQNKKTVEIAASYDTEQKLLERKLARIDNAYFAGVYELEEYQKLRAAVLDALDLIKRNRQDAAQKEEKKLNLKVVKKGLDNYDKMSPAQQNQFLISIIEKIVAHKSESGYIFEINYR